MNVTEGGDANRLSHLAQACSLIIAFTEGSERSNFATDPQLISAVCYQVAILGEAVKQLSDDFRTGHPEVPWKKIAGMRDRLVHGYDRVDLDELWHTVTKDVPVLLRQLHRIQEQT
jgi:uncharacterized protein with HEPN domain